jgi:hypothetical protein
LYGGRRRPPSGDDVCREAVVVHHPATPFVGRPWSSAIRPRRLSGGSRRPPSDDDVRPEAVCVRHPTTTFVRRPSASAIRRRRLSNEAAPRRGLPTEAPGPALWRAEVVALISAVLRGHRRRRPPWTRASSR